jgi:hypothetical protein
VGDSNQIDPVEGGYDIVIGHTLISHVATPGGRLVLFDGDYASLVAGIGNYYTYIATKPAT